MKLEVQLGLAANVDAPAAPWDIYLAKFISSAFSPPLLAVAGLGIAAAALSSLAAAAWAGFYLVVAVLVPVGYIAWKVQTGEITDFHMRLREQRAKPMALMVLCSLAAWLVMAAFSAPAALTIFAGVGILQTAFLWLVSLRWKISGHSAAIAAFAVFLILLFGRGVWWSLFTIPMVSWARLRLNRHDLLQTILGACAGAAFIYIAFLFAAATCQEGILLCE
jgi:membrane-associated phospholipid phosphatase